MYLNDMNSTDFSRCFQSFNEKSLGNQYQIYIDEN